MLEAVTATLPYSILVPDNRRTIAGAKKKTLTSRYRQGMESAYTELIKQVKGRPVYPRQRVSVRYSFWMPDKRKRDPANLLKFLNDVLSGVAYADDEQIDHQEWTRRGLDKSNARVEIEVTPWASDGTAL